MTTPTRPPHSPRPADGLTVRTEPRAADVEAVREIVSSTGFFHGFEVDVAVELVQERLARGLASEYHFAFVDDERGRAVAYSCFGPIACTVGSFDLYWIAVHQGHRGGGLGRRLLRATEGLIAAGVPDASGAIVPGRKVYAETSGREQYAPTRGFYEACGYVAEARLRDFYAAGDDKVVYVKDAAGG